MWNGEPGQQNGEGPTYSSTPTIVSLHNAWLRTQFSDRLNIQLGARSLEQSLQPESVRRFLTAVARGGASTDLFSDDVAEWLSAHNALNSFRIVAGPPIGRD